MSSSTEDPAVSVYGAPWCPHCKRVKKFFAAHRVRYENVDIDEHPEAVERLRELQAGGQTIPTVVYADGTCEVNPSDEALARRIGLTLQAARSVYDLVIVGGGPAGLAAAIHAAREGIDAIVVASALGGQAGITDRIDNYPGFPDGISGAELAGRFAAQARHYGVELLAATSVTSIEPDGKDLVTSLSCGQQLISHAVIVATGSTYRRLNVPGEEDLIGVGVHFCATCDGPFYKGADEVIVIGGGNSALEEGLHLSEFAGRVRVLARGAQTTSRTPPQPGVLRDLQLTPGFHTHVAHTPPWEQCPAIRRDLQQSANKGETVSIQTGTASPTLTHSSVPPGKLARLAWRARRARRPLVDVTPPPDDIKAEWNVPVVMRDGVTLRVNMFRPATDKPVPAIMSAHPYSKDKIPVNGRKGRGLNIQYRMLPQPHPLRISAWTGWEAPDPAVWVPRGYAVVNADLRGGGTSEGTGHLFSDEEALDYAELIEWVARQTWCSGKVGLDGISYLAISQYKVAALRPGHLAAICPWEGLSDLYRDWVYPGGVRENGFSLLWATMTRKSARVEPNLAQALNDHTERDQFYQDLTPDLPAISAPMLACGSFSDHNLHTRGSFEAYRRSGSSQKWLYTHRSGKWSQYYGSDATETRAAFFDHFLRGVDNGWDQRPAVRLAIHESGPDPVDILHEDAWPPADLTWSRLYLSPHGLSGEPGAASTVSYANKGAGAAFEWALPADLDLIGPMALRLYLSATGNDDPRVFVAVHKVHDGIAARFEGTFGFNGDAVTTGWQRAAFRELDEQLSAPYRPVHTFRKAEPLRAGEIVPVDIELREQATRFRVGDKLRLEVRGHWHFPRNPVTGQFPCGYRTSKRGSCVIHTGLDTPSALLLGHRPAGPGS